VETLTSSMIAQVRRIDCQTHRKEMKPVVNYISADTVKNNLMAAKIKQTTGKYKNHVSIEEQATHSQYQTN